MKVNGLHDIAMIDSRYENAFTFLNDNGHSESDDGRASTERLNC